MLWPSVSKANHGQTKKASISIKVITPGQQKTKNQQQQQPTKIPQQTKQKYLLSQGTPLGEGNSAVVRLAQSQPDGKIVAVKEFRAVAKNNSCPSKVMAEYYVAHGLKHENIVQTLDLQFANKKWCMFMEYVPSNLLDSMSPSTSLQTEQIDSYFLQLVSGVAYIHKCGFAHRDLKLENLLLTKNNQLKIADFGTVATHKSIPVEQVGSLPYMAPELFSERTYYPQPADVWSVAIIYCCMVLRRFPWSVANPSSDSKFRTFSKQLNKDFVAEQRDWDRRDSEETLVEEDTLLPQLPAHTRDIIGRMLQINPQRRPVIGRVRAYFDSPRLSTLWEEV